MEGDHKSGEEWEWFEREKIALQKRKKIIYSIINKKTVLIFKIFWKELNLLINIEFINIKHY